MGQQHLFLILSFALWGLAGLAPALLTPVDIQPSVRTDPVSDDPDDPAIWVHPTDPALSLVIGTNRPIAQCRQKPC